MNMCYSFMPKSWIFSFRHYLDIRQARGPKYAFSKINHVNVLNYFSNKFNLFDLAQQIKPWFTSNIA